MVLVIFVRLVESGLPFLHGGDDLGGVVGVELDLGALAHVVLMLLEEFEEVFDGFAVDFLWREQRA